MKLSIIVPVLNSHEIVWRQLLHLVKIDFESIPSVEMVLMDDGSDPPISDHGISLSNLRIVPTHDFRPWTWALARNAGAKLAHGEYLLMIDLDYILSRDAILQSLAFTGDRLGFHREFGVLDEHGNFSQGTAELMAYGVPALRIAVKGAKLPPHPNNFVIRKSLYWEMGGYREDLFQKPYPQGEDRWFKKKLLEFVKAGKCVMDDVNRPPLYMFPNGQFCGDVDHNPFTLFHGLTRKTPQNHAHTHPRYAKVAQ